MLLVSLVGNELVDDPVTHDRVVGGNTNERGLNHVCLDINELGKHVEVFFDLVDRLFLVGNLLQSSREFARTDLSHYFSGRFLLVSHNQLAIVSNGLRIVVASH